MAKKTKRRPSYSSRATLSPYETAIEQVFKELDVVVLADDSTAEALTRVPDYISAPSTLAADTTITITTPDKNPAVSRIVKVANDDSAQTVSISVRGGTALVVAANTIVDVYIADSSTNDAPVALSVTDRT